MHDIHHPVRTNIMLISLILIFSICAKHNLPQNIKLFSQFDNFYCKIVNKQFCKNLYNSY